MLQPALAELLKTPVLDAVDVLPDGRLLIRTAVPPELFVSDVAGFSPEGECLNAVDGAVVRRARKVAADPS